MARLAFEPMIKTPQEFAAFLAAEKEKWPLLLSSAGFKAE
jgi:hypothetical protein